jgi:hypothetical protein
MAPFDRDFVCANAFPGLRCDLGEMTALGILFWLSGLISGISLVLNIRRSKARFFLLDQTVLFWLFVSLWQLYHGAISVVPFPWTTVTFRLWYQALNHILMFIPMCLVILILFDLLFTYRNPGHNAMLFFRTLFVLFLLTFVVLGGVLSVVNVRGEKDAYASLALWCACTDFILAIFFALPAKALLSAVTYPMVQPEDECCVSFCKLGIAVYVLLFGGRTLWNATHYFGGNVLQVWLDRQVSGGRPTPPARAINFLFIFFFDFMAAVLAMISVYLFKKHDVMFNENPYYTRQN